MDPDTKAALDRIHKTLLAHVAQDEDGLGHKNHPHPAGFDDAGNEITGLRTPLAKVMAGDTLAVCEAVPLAKVTKIVKDLRTGVRNLQPERIVYQQQQCLWHLLGLFGLTPPKPGTPLPEEKKPEPAKA